MTDLKTASTPPIEDFTEEITKLAKGEEQSITEIGCQCGQIRNSDHV